LISHARTLPEGCLENRWPTVLAEEIGEGLVSEFLELLHAVFSEQVGAFQVSSSN
jgi:hypothetical protein